MNNATPTAFDVYMSVVRRHNEAVARLDVEVFIGLLDAAIAIISDIRDKYGVDCANDFMDRAQRITMASPAYDGRKLTGGMYHLKK